MAENPHQDTEIAHHAAEIADLERQSGTASRLFDVRTVIGALFLVYGVLIGGAGLFPDAAELEKAQGVNINLWTGLSMLVVGGLFLLWLRLRPLRAPQLE
ncbi:hypothetical protein EIL87_16825 [Saccharopolyspora rhizosphaerae]|uniref:Uncharacterized protein n=1 Tax=Saccharopolyspora rhizosphaerae TaxID=2492662 RepID=A0A426JR98_9PSEU|nr:hypothetical protein [Saccharopolyspora rhizosphaerae]RRO15671.1 hypothetical protein EIL87_16825 [Saccharopolyspora rhizosphaerae]